MEDELMGTIKLFAGNFAPMGYFTCEGQILQIKEYTALFAIIGTYYGGDGINTFKLPDLRGAFPTQCSNISGEHLGGTYVLGQTGGAQAATITALNMSTHSHSKLEESATSTTENISATTALQANNSDGTNSNTPAINDAFGKTVDTISNSDPTSLQQASWGSNQAPLPTVPPFVAMQYIICYQGIFPSRP
ncbi:tail fiber protein [Flavobacterium sp. K77]|uniref:phage tail protein n=1 Tax=Flavobacterium sp. K77 TaxID=2910676 RepID=UPI001F1A5755|nr:tail fiber protein [Flavobacterium sp. K77]MCF6140583.1 tail fiber protein [Flavobacterium sp. K77]